MAFEITDANFQETIDNNDVVVIDFWAEWCGPCKLVGPHIESMSTEYADKAVVGKCDVDSNPEVSFKYGIRSIPTVLYLKNGEIVDKQVGATTKNALVGKLEGLLTPA